MKYKSILDEYKEQEIKVKMIGMQSKWKRNG